MPHLRTWLAATLAVLAPAVSMAAPMPVKIDRFEGEVVQINGDVHSGVLPGKGLQPGTQLQTGADGRAELSLSGAPTIGVGAGTDLLVHSVEQGVLRLRIAGGAMRIDARAAGAHPARDVRINVGDLRLRVNGADAWTEVGDRGGQVCLISGVVEAQQPNSTVRLDTPGQCLRQSGLTSQWSMVPMNVLEERVALVGVSAATLAAAPAPEPKPEPKIKALPLPLPLPIEPEPAPKVAIVELPAVVAAAPAEVAKAPVPVETPKLAPEAAAVATAPIVAALPVPPDVPAGNASRKTVQPAPADKALVPAPVPPVIVIDKPAPVAPSPPVIEKPAPGVVAKTAEPAAPAVAVPPAIVIVETAKAAPADRPVAEAAPVDPKPELAAGTPPGTSSAAKVTTPPVEKPVKTATLEKPAVATVSTARPAPAVEAPEASATPTPEVLYPHTPPVIVLAEPAPPAVAAPSTNADVSSPAAGKLAEMPASAGTVAMAFPVAIEGPALPDPPALLAAAPSKPAPKAPAAPTAGSKDTAKPPKAVTPETELAMATPASSAAGAGDGKRWRVVLGSMPEPEKAETEAERLNARGWAVEAREYRVGDRHGYRIGFGEFTERGEAQKALEEFLVQYPDATAWLAKY